MHILKVSQSFSLFNRRGDTAHFRPLAEHLARRGHNVTIVAANYACPSRTREERWEGLEVIYLGSAFRYRAVTLNLGIRGICRQRLRKYDLVHIYGMYDLLGPVVASYCRRWNVPYVLEPMGMYQPAVSSLWKKKLYHRFLGGALIRGAARVIAVSALEQQDLICAGMGPAQIVTRRNGVEVQYLAPKGKGQEFRSRLGIPVESPLVLFLGRISPIKNLELLIRAFSSLPSNNAWLVLAGPQERGSYQRRLEATAAGLGILNRVIFAGPVYGEYKAAALEAADVFVLPSLTESFGIAAAEAMACGTPVVVTEGCGIAPYLKDRAGLVVAPEEAKLAQAIERLLTDSALHARFKAQAPSVAGELSWDEPTSQMEALYSELTAKGSQELVNLNTSLPADATR